MKYTNYGLILGVLLAVGCSKPEASQQQKAQAEASAQASANPTLAALTNYEAIRAKLAGDELTGLAELGGGLQTTASAAAAQESGPAAEALKSVAKAAGQLKAATSFEDARTAFGDVSRGVVSLLAAKPELRAGRYVFECPMATGYKKWVQSTDKIDNPYMGKRMLECGAATSWSA